jgi:hypothetical protein
LVCPLHHNFLNTYFLPSLSLSLRLSRHLRYVTSLVETIQYYSGHFQQQEEQLARHVQSWAMLCDEKLKLSLQKLHTIKKAVATRNEPSYSAVKAGDAGGGMSHEMLEEKLFFAQVKVIFQMRGFSFLRMFLLFFVITIVFFILKFYYHMPICLTFLIVSSILSPPFAPSPLSPPSLSHLSSPLRHPSQLLYAILSNMRLNTKPSGSSCSSP